MGTTKITKDQVLIYPRELDDFVNITLKFIKKVCG
jgi:hypothetical protein